MKTSIKIPETGFHPLRNAIKWQEKSGKSNYFIYAMELLLLYMMLFAGFSAFAQENTNQPGHLEFAKQTAVFNSGKVYLNWIVKANSSDCIYVIERSSDGKEYEPVGIKEGIGSDMELLYSWVDSSPSGGAVQYRIKQIDDQGILVAQADPSSVNMPETNPLFRDKSNRMVQVK
jgi:hypothetical protein